MAALVYTKVLLKLPDSVKSDIQNNQESKEAFDLLIKNDEMLKKIIFLCIDEYVESLKKGEHLNFEFKTE